MSRGQNHDMKFAVSNMGLHFVLGQSLFRGSATFRPSLASHPRMDSFNSGLGSLGMGGMDMTHKKSLDTNASTQLVQSSNSKKASGRFRLGQMHVATFDFDVSHETAVLLRNLGEDIYRLLSKAEAVAWSAKPAEPGPDMNATPDTQANRIRLPSSDDDEPKWHQVEDVNRPQAESFRAPQPGACRPVMLLQETKSAEHPEDPATLSITDLSSRRTPGGC